MIQAALNNVMVQISTKYIQNISNIMKVAALENNSSVDPVEIVNIVGTVHSIPKSVIFEGFSTKDIQVGDTAIFRFDLIYDFKEKGKGLEPIYRNRIWHNGQEYWSCDIRKIFGVIRYDEIIMINGYTMITDFTLPKIYLPASAKKIRGTQKSQIMHIGSPKYEENEIEVQSGDTIFFNPNTAAKYQIKGKPFRIIQQNKILGKEIA